MRVRIGLFFNRDQVDAFEALDLYDAAIARFPLANELASPDELKFGLDQITVLDAARQHLERSLPAFCLPIHEYVTIDSITGKDIRASEFVSFNMVAVDCSDAVRLLNSKPLCCRQCGSALLKPLDNALLDYVKLPNQIDALSFSCFVDLLCSADFASDWIKTGLTGLEFSPFSTQRELLLARTILHHWNAVGGVCESCLCATSIRAAGFFNLKEKYTYDIQYLRYHCGGSYLMSSRAFEFLKKYFPDVLSNKYCYAVVRPGLLAEQLCPENRFFAAPNSPTHALRCPRPVAVRGKRGRSI